MKTICSNALLIHINCSFNQSLSYKKSIIPYTMASKQSTIIQSNFTLTGIYIYPQTFFYGRFFFWTSNSHFSKTFFTEIVMTVPAFNVHCKHFHSLSVKANFTKLKFLTPIAYLFFYSFFVLFCNLSLLYTISWPWGGVTDWLCQMHTLSNTNTYYTSMRFVFW